MKILFSLLTLIAFSATAAVTYVGNFTGNGAGVTNVNTASLTVVPLTNNDTRSFTLSNSLVTGSLSALTGPANNEVPSAGWIRSLFNNGMLLYNTTNVFVGATNSDYPNIFQFRPELPSTWARGYTNTALTAGNYLGTAIATNRFLQLIGPVSVDAYIGFTSLGAPTLTLKPELYYSYDLTNWLGDFSAANESITLGATNLYQWTVSFPTVTATNDAGFYLARRFKVATSSALLASSVLWITVGTNAASGTNAGSHIHVTGSDITSGNAFLAQTQTFTGSNTFSGGLSAVNPRAQNMIVSSNGWAAGLPSDFAEGDTVYRSSNGIPHVVTKIGGVTTIYRLIP